MKLKVLNFFTLDLAGVFLASFVLISALLYSAGPGCGEGSGSECGNDNLVVPNPDFTSVPLSAAFHNTFAIKADGTLWGWGSNDAGQISTGTGRNNINTPTQIGSDHDWAIISTGWYHVMAIKTNGTLWGWGSNDYGQLGLGTAGYQSGNKNVPKQIGTDNDWIAVAAGNQHTVALKRDNSLWTWGLNEAGQLGNNNLNNVTKPTRVGTDNDWIQIAAGQFYTIALKQNGSIWSWGSNSYGELGYETGEALRNPTPRKIGNDTDWKEIHAGGFNAAIKQNGALWIWGQGVYGITRDKSKWIEIPGSPWQTVSVGNNQGFAFSSRSGWYGWGADTLFSNYNLAGNYVPPTQPVQIVGFGWTTLIAGYDYAYGVIDDGSLWGWGKNSLGELGSGDFTDIDIPRQVWEIK
jgi:hypothetical protein